MPLNEDTVIFVNYKIIKNIYALIYIGIVPLALNLYYAFSSSIAYKSIHNLLNILFEFSTIKCYQRPLKEMFYVT